MVSSDNTYCDVLYLNKVIHIPSIVGPIDYIAQIVYIAQILNKQGSEKGSKILK